jgi:hypothetical protein
VSRIPVSSLPALDTFVLHSKAIPGSAPANYLPVYLASTYVRGLYVPVTKTFVITSSDNYLGCDRNQDKEQKYENADEFGNRILEKDRKRLCAKCKATSS